MTKRVAVVGGGIIGLCCAAFLRSDADVMVFDSGRTGDGASKGNAGWITPAHASPVPGPGVISYGLSSLFRTQSPLYIKIGAVPGLAPWLLRFAANCTREAHVRGTRALAALNGQALPAYERLRQLGVRFELHNEGLLYCFANPSNVEGVRAEVETMTRYGYAAPDVLDGEAVRRFEPALSETVKAGLFVREECHVDPTELTAALERANVDRGVSIHAGQAVSGFDRTGSAVTAVRTTEGSYPVDEVVVAAGAWTGELLRRTLGVSLPIQAGKGYSFTVRPRVVPGRALSFYEAKVAITPVGDRMRLAGTMEFSGVNEWIDMRRINAIYSSASQFLQEGAPADRRDDWVGMRPLLPDGLPVVGRLRRYANVIVASGHGMLGVTQGAITGELVAGLIADREAFPELSLFSPRRFGA